MFILKSRQNEGFNPSRYSKKLVLLVFKGSTVLKSYNTFEIIKFVEELLISPSIFFLNFQKKYIFAKICQNISPEQYFFTSNYCK